MATPRLCNSCLNYLDKAVIAYKRATNSNDPLPLTPFLPSVIRVCVISMPALCDRHRFPSIHLCRVAIDAIVIRRYGQIGSLLSIVLHSRRTMETFNKGVDMFVVYYYAGR